MTTDPRFCPLEATRERALEKIMKDGIHPNYVNCEVTCGCGSSFVTRATVAELKVEICGACHPFYTGKQKFVDTAGRVEKFRQRYAKSSTDKAAQ